MATFLYRLGRAAYGRRRTVLLAWVLLLAVLGGLAAGFAKGTTSTLTIPGVESIKAADLLQERFPASGAGGAAGRIVFAAPAGESVTDPQAKAAIEKTVDEASKGDNVAAVSDPFQTKAISQNGRIAYATVTYTVTADQITASDQSALLDSGDAAKSAGLQVEYGGEAVQAQPQTSSAEGLGVLVALLVLAVTFGSLLAAGLPLITALVGVATGMAGVYALTSVLDLTSTAPTLGLMVGLAVGIDYALFIITRHRENLASGLDPHEAAGRAVGTAGSAVVFAGATVDDRPGGPLGRRHPVPDHDGSGGGRHGRDRGPRRAHPGAGLPRLRGRAVRPLADPRSARSSGAPWHPPVVRQPLGRGDHPQARRLPAGGDRRRRHHRGAGAEAGARPARRRHPAHPDDPAQGLRPARGGLRARLQRTAHAGGRRQRGRDQAGHQPRWPASCRASTTSWR